VTLKWWRNLWLNEGFVRWLPKFFVLDIFGDDCTLSDWSTSTMPNVTTSDGDAARSHGGRSDFVEVRNYDCFHCLPRQPRYPIVVLDDVRGVAHAAWETQW
jgi:hypothetical protein